LWKGRPEDPSASLRAGAAGEGCRLTTLERALFDVRRVGDVPGFEIPLRYFQFLRTGDAGLIEDVLEHNRLDLISTAAVMAHALGLAREGPDACRDGREQLGLGRLYERAGDRDRAVRAYELAARETNDDRDVRRHALARLASMLRREARFDEAADAWTGVLALADADSYESGAASFGALERRAVEALAIHHEHRARNLTSARRYAQALRSAATGRARTDADHRLGRLDRKLKAAEPSLDWE
jgi:tetratricopeptide (TPR) repeat protein